jgi:DNA-binding NarL/FixJ family response regulator
VNGSIKVIILDGDGAYRRKVGAWLAQRDDIAVVGEAGDVAEALWQIQETGPDVALLDVRTMPAGAHVVAEVRALSPGTEVIVLNEAGQEREVIAAFREGALGHLVKGQAGADEVAAAIRLVQRGQAVLCPDVAGRILDHVLHEQRQRK